MPDRALPLAFIIDAHADTPQRFIDEGWDFRAREWRRDIL